MTKENSRWKTEFIIRSFFFALEAIPLVVVGLMFFWKVTFDGVGLRAAIADIFGSESVGRMIIIIYFLVVIITGIIFNQFEKKRLQRIKEWAESITKQTEENN